MNKKLIVSIADLSVSVSDKLVVKNIFFSIEVGSVHAIMGPNGSGKSSLAYALAGHPSYEIKNGSIKIDGNEIMAFSPYERARQGLFLAFQNPPEIPGVSVASFLHEAYTAIGGAQLSPVEFNSMLLHRCDQLNIDHSFISRGLNEGFSGGEKKRLELLQLVVLKPRIAVLDEIDSGLDIDALKAVAEGIAFARAENPLMAIVLITHYQRILRYIAPDYIHVMSNGSIITSGDMAIADRLESNGYEVFKDGTYQKS